ncbi:fumarylacetoacetate hydrolase family protein [Aquibacillus rhizosphaerae]|uniref:Fumarylacetoacetate hydrolase family protein n=1 Tax=Aquibacillus rhizosphaerae TaxID=3051431 RepID=A0ABT7L582_9BACI|nr:fumarylacetoacetate hydrolase family protein [Aquibacillus sp. LR5S19]MDL4841014.1 fumarylacetoacetate hydrolase family protein [Aquibacillus sp. LR5S19]
MKLVTVKVNGKEQVGIVNENKTVLLETINAMESKCWKTQVFEILQEGQLKEIKKWYDQEGKEKLNQDKYVGIDAETAPLYRNPRKILGIGMNYMEKAMELSDHPPKLDPVYFIKPDSSLIGPWESIVLPSQSNHITAEAELGIVIGKTCKDITYVNAQNYIAGFTSTLDMTAKDIHAEDPRYLQRSKSFDAFFSLGNELITIDEFDDINSIVVQTSLNGRIAHQNSISNMMYSPWFIVSYFSQMMTLYPGDIIMTGTPGSVMLKTDDVPGCHITNFATLKNVAGVKVSNKSPRIYS